MKEVGGEEGEGRRRGEEERQEEERHYQGRVGMPPALALRPWMAPPGTKVAHLVPDLTGRPGLGRPDVTGVHTRLLRPNYSHSPAPDPLASGGTVASWHPAQTRCQLLREGRGLGPSVFRASPFRGGHESEASHSYI